MGLSVVQQHIFSYFNLVKIESLDSALETFEEILHHLNLSQISSKDNLRSEISSINEVIKIYDLELVESTDEITTEKSFALINTSHNFVTQKLKLYDESTTQAFSKIIKECVMSEKGCVSETHCLNIISQIGITKTAAQSIIEKLIKEKWLIIINGNVCLSMRSITELEQNIKQQYPDEIKYCPFCKLFIMQGYICSNCKVRCHFACLSIFYMQTKTNNVCPICKQVWVDMLSVINKIRNLKSKDGDHDDDRNDDLHDNHDDEEDFEESLSTAPTKKQKKN